MLTMKRGKPQPWKDSSPIHVYKNHVRGIRFVVEAYEARSGVEVDVPWWADDDDDQTTATIAEYEAYIAAIESVIEAHEAALGVKLGVPGSSSLQTKLDAAAAWNLVRDYYQPIGPLYLAFKEAKTASFIQQGDELRERHNNALFRDDPEYVVLSATHKAYFFGGMIDDRDYWITNIDTEVSKYLGPGSYYTDPGAAAAAAYLATYYNTYSYYVSWVVGETVFFAVVKMLDEALRSDYQEARLVDAALAVTEVGRTVNNLVGQRLARHVEGRFNADRAASITLETYGGSEIKRTVSTLIRSKALITGCWIRTFGDLRITDILDEAIDET